MRYAHATRTAFSIQLSAISHWPMATLLEVLMLTKELKSCYKCILVLG
ncbi:MAG: hypothetical protein F6K56_05745 [Moorea sp. SIO3G5]|nr:hypothetical protein [Moorena sp. SIO3G5]